MAPTNKGPMRPALGYIVLYEEIKSGYREKYPEYRKQKAALKKAGREKNLDVRRCPVDELWKTSEEMASRPGLQEIIQKSGPDFPVVLIDELDCGLSSAQLAVLLLYFHKKSVQVMEMFELFSMTARIESVHNTLAALSPDELARTKKDFAELKKRATRRSTGHSVGQAPFGQSRQEKQTLKLIFKLRRKQTDGSRMSYRRIADRLNQDPVHGTRHGEPWLAKTIQGIVRRMRPNLK